METSFCHDSSAKYTEVYSDERAVINRVLKLAELYPGDVDIRYRPEDNDGAILAHVPASWVKLVPPRRVDMSEERKQELRDRLAALRENKKE